MSNIITMVVDLAELVMKFDLALTCERWLSIAWTVALVFTMLIVDYNYSVDIQA